MRPGRTSRPPISVLPWLAAAACQLEPFEPLDGSEATSPSTQDTDSADDTDGTDTTDSDTQDPGPKEPQDEVEQIGSEEAPGTVSGFRSISIATDSLNQPHIFMENYDAGLYAYHRIGGSWRTEEPWYAPGGSVGSVHTEIDAADRAWVSFTTFLSGDADVTGEWVALLVGMASDPGLLWAQNIRPYTGFSGNLSTDRHYPDSCWRMGGQPHPTYRFESDGSYAQDITMSPGESGEGIRFRISSNQQGAEPGVWHAATGIWTDVNDGGYQSSTRLDQGLDPTPWISRSYPMTGDSYYPSVGVDLEDAEVAYLAGSYDGLIINIWTGQEMMFSIDALHQVQADIAEYGNGVERFTPTWAPALGGGSFICFTGADWRVKLAYVSPQGAERFGAVTDIGAGSRCAIATDSQGDLHLAYDNGGVRYRLVSTR